MKLLIVTQAVDDNDPVLGFFVRWIEELATRAERVEAICLTEGKHALAANVSVHSLGKERGRPALGPAAYALRFLVLAWRLRREYDGVFVHMNQEYVLLAGVFWRLSGKRIVLWRNHAAGSFATRLACALATTVCHTSPQAFVARASNALQMPLGIDTTLFTPPSTPPKPDSILFIGRLDAVKRVDLFIRALDLLKDTRPFTADVVGNPTGGRSQYAHDVRNLASPLALAGALTMQSAVPYRQTPELFASHAIYVNLTPSGSFDKTIGEAMAAGCLVVCANGAVEKIVDPGLFVRDATPEGVSRVIGTALTLAQTKRAVLAGQQRDHIVANHSLDLLANRLAALFKVY